MADCLKRGEAPFASHLLYTQPGVLNDNVPSEREHGIVAGFAIAERLDATVVYIDNGVSNGMRMGIIDAVCGKRPVEIRSLESEKAACITAQILAASLREDLARLGRTVPEFTVDGPGERQN
jgi:hypothetical protein